METGQIVGGKYRLRKKIGEGGMGSVWSAVHDTLDRTVAIKFLQPAGADSDSAAARFVAEAKSAARVKHLFVIAVFAWNTVLLGSAGMVWLGGSTGLARYNPANDSWATWRMADGLIGNSVTSIALESQQVDGMPHDILWIGTTAGVSRFDVQLGTFQSFTTADGLPSDSVTKVLVMSNGTKLFATDAGIARYTGR